MSREPIRQQQQQPTAGLTAENVNELRRRATFFVHNPFFTMRDQVFRELFYRLAVFYSRAVPRSWRRLFEFSLLFQALLSLVLLTYVHFTFNRNNPDCLKHIVDSWSYDGILRVEVLTNNTDISNYTLFDSYRKEMFLYGSNGNPDNYVPSPLHHSSNLTANTSSNISSPASTVNSTDDDNDDGTDDNVAWKKSDDGSWGDGFPYEWLAWDDDRIESRHESFWSFIEFLFGVNFLDDFVENLYIYEYATEFGFLRMSPKMRQRLNLTTTFVVLDASKEKCFGSAVGRALLSDMLGYDDVMLYSIKQLVGRRPHKGYCRNVASGDYYKFVDMSISRFCYVPAAFLLVLFTMSISMLLRYAHQQVFIFMVDVLQVFDRTVVATFPLAPLLTAILALIGVEALMSELFTDASTGFYVILVVWLAEQYDVICCHTFASKRHWLRFFYLYHFIFYAYYYRFNGHFSYIALATSWLFIQHSMVYFFHHYELPAIEHQVHVNSLIAHVHQRSPVRGLVTVISQTSPTEISRFTLDTNASMNTLTTTTHSQSGDGATGASAGGGQPNGSPSEQTVSPPSDQPTTSPSSQAELVTPPSNGSVDSSPSVTFTAVADKPEGPLSDPIVAPETTPEVEPVELSSTESGGQSSGQSFSLLADQLPAGQSSDETVSPLISDLGLSTPVGALETTPEVEPVELSSTESSGQYSGQSFSLSADQLSAGQSSGETVSPPSSDLGLSTPVGAEATAPPKPTDCASPAPADQVFGAPPFCPLDASVATPHVTSAKLSRDNVQGGATDTLDDISPAETLAPLTATDVLSVESMTSVNSSPVTATTTTDAATAATTTIAANSSSL